MRSTLIKSWKHIIAVAALCTAAASSPSYAANEPDTYPLYVESDGNQYVETSLNPDANMTIEADIDIISGGDVVGCSNYESYPITVNNGYIAGRLLKSDFATTDVPANSGRKRIVSSATLNGKLSISVDGVLKAQSSGNCTVSTTGKSMYVFAGKDGTKCSAKLYGLKIYINDELVRDFVPGIKDGVAGLYDRQNDVWYTSSGAPLVAPTVGPDGEINYARFPSGATLMEPSAYVQTGLVGHFDGIRNAGLGQAHDSSATTWVNLGSGGSANNATLTALSSNIPSGSSDGEWTDFGYYFKGKRYFDIGGTISLGKAATVQLATEWTTTIGDCSGVSWPLMFGGSSADSDQFGIWHDKGKLSSLNLKILNTKKSVTNWDGYSLNAIFDGANTRCSISKETAYSWQGSMPNNTISSANTKYVIGTSGLTDGYRGPRMFKGVIKAVRIYDRILTTDELAWNRVVDEIRFRGVVTNGYVEVASSFAGAEGTEASGTYYVNGSHAFTAPASVTIDGKMYEPSGYRLERYNSSTQTWSEEGTYSGVSFAYTNFATSAGARITWNWRLKKVEADSYVQRGLIANFDGIRNAGLDQPHDSVQRTWKNLVAGGPDASFEGNGGAWNAAGNGFVFDGSSVRADMDAPGVDMDHANSTIQIACDVDYTQQSSGSGWYPGIFVMADQDYGIFMRNTSGKSNALEYKPWPYSNDNSNQRPKIEPWGGKYVTAAFDGNKQYLVEGTSLGAGKTRSSYSDQAAKQFVWGGNPSATTRYVKGTYHSVRIYNATLTEDELVWNRAIDEIRFRGAAPNGTVVVASSLAGAEGTEANGTYYMNGSYTFTAPASVTVDGRTYALTGYKLERYNATTKAWDLAGAYSGTSFAYASSESTTGVRLTWCWQASLLHRWTFNSNYSDSIGDADATLGGNGNVSLSDGKAILAGGGGAGYLNLGAGVLGRGGAATLELWATNITVAANWAYLFTYGIHDSDTLNLITLCNRSSGLSYDRTTRNGMLEGYVNGTQFIRQNEIMIGMPESMAYHYSVTFKVNGANTDTRWMVRDAATGFLLAEHSVTVPNLTLAGAADAGWMLTLGHNPFTNSTLDLNAGFDEVRVWDGILSDEQLMANALAGPDAPLGGSAEDVVVNAGETFAVPTVGGYGYKTEKAVTLGTGAKIRFDTTGYFGKGLRFKTGGIAVSSGSVLDYVELSDSANYAATMEDANTILVQLKSTIPYESTWTGGAPTSSADLANAANWTSVNASGTTITAAPTAKTTVILPATALATFSLPTDFTPDWGRVVLGGRTATQSGRIAGTPNMNKLAYLYRGVADYTSLGAKGVASINGNGSGVAFLKNYLVQSQVRFDGWVNVPAEKAGRWFINCQFDDAVTLFIDGARVFHDPCWHPAVVGGCFVSEGWHRFTLIAADGGGGYGCHANDTVNGTKVPFRITVNGSLTAFYLFTFGTDSDTVTLSGDADWRALGEIELESGVTIDLNGHNLAVADITRSSLGAAVVNNAATPAILYVNSDPAASQAQASGLVSGLPIVQYGSKFSVWTGAAGDGRFANAANWSPQPESFTDPECRFCFENSSALTVTVDADVTMESLEFDGSDVVTLANPNAATTNTLTVTKIVNSASASPVVNCAVQFADTYLVDCATAPVNFAGGATATYPDPSTTDNAASHALTGVINFTADWTGAAYANPYTVPNGSKVYGKTITGVGSSEMLRVEEGGYAEFDTITYNRDWYKIFGTLRSKGVVTYSGNTGNTADTGVFQALGFRKSGLSCYLRLRNYRVGAEGFYLYRDYNVHCYDVNPTFYADDDFAFTGDYSSNPADWSFNINNKTVTFVTEGHTVTFTANVTGNGTIKKVGEGVFVAKSQNANATAAVSVEGGTYVIANSFGMGTGAITVKSGATLKVAVAELSDVANAVTAEAGSTLEFKASGTTMMGALTNLTLPESGTVNVLFDDSTAEGNTEYTLMDGLTEDDKAKLALPSVEGLTFRFDGAALKVMKIAQRSLTWTNTARDHSFDTLANWTVNGAPATALPLGGDIVTLNVSDSTPITVTNRLYGLTSMSVTGSGEASFAFSGRGGLSFAALDIAAGASARIPGTMGLADGALTGRGTLILDPGAGKVITMTRDNGANAVPFDAAYFWGETVIASGTVKFGNIWSFGSRRDNADNRQIPTVRVKGGATLDENAFSTGDYAGETLRVILEEGATLKSTGNASSGLTSLVLEGNATVDTSSGRVVACFGYDCGSIPVAVTLGTNTLTKVGTGQFYLSACNFSGSGTLDVQQGEVRVKVDGWNYFPTSTLTDGTLRIRSGATFTLEKRGDNPTHFTVKNLILDGTLARTGDGCVFTVTGTVTGSGTAAALTLAQGATIKPGGVGFLTAGSISGAVMLDARDAAASATGESIPLFKVGSAEALPAKGSIGFAGGSPDGWELVLTDDGLGYELRARGFMILVY